MLSAATRNHPKRAPEARGQHELRPATKTTAFQTSARGQRLVLTLGLTRVVPLPTWEHPPASCLDSKISLVTAKPFPADKTSNQDRNKAQRHDCISEQAGYRNGSIPCPSSTNLHTRPTQTKRQEGHVCSTHLTSKSWQLSKSLGVMTTERGSGFGPKSIACW